MNRQISTAVVARLITYPFPASQGGGTRPEEAVARIAGNSYGAGQVSATVARVLNTATTLTLGVVVSRQAAADETGDPEVSLKILEVNRATLDRFRTGVIENLHPFQYVPPVCPRGHYPVVTDYGWDCIPGDEILFGAGEEWQCEPEGIIAVGVQVLATSEALTEGTLRDGAGVFLDLGSGLRRRLAGGALAATDLLVAAAHLQHAADRLDPGHQLRGNLAAAADRLFDAGPTRLAEHAKHQAKHQAATAGLQPTQIILAKHQ